MITIKGTKKLNKNQLRSINAGNQLKYLDPSITEIKACIRRHQIHINNARRAEPTDEKMRKIVITGLIEDEKKCFNGTNIL